MNLTDLDIFTFFSESCDYIKLISADNHLIQAFFDNVKGKYKLYIMLYLHGIRNYLKLPNYDFNFSQINYFYKSVKDCKTYKLTLLIKLFDEIFKDGLERENHSVLKLSYLIDKNKFIQLENKNSNIINVLDNI